MHPTTLAVVLTLPVALCHAQSPLSGLAQGVIIEDSASGSRKLMNKRPGDHVAVPFTNAHSSSPTFTIPALLHHLGAGAGSAISNFEMNAVSTGNDNLPVEAAAPVNGHTPYWEVTAIPGSGWAAMALSVVDDQHLAAVPGTIFEERLAYTNGTGIGSDLFSYWFDTNLNLPPSLVGKAHLDVGYEHLGTGANNPVTALDTYMPAVVEARGTSSFVTPNVRNWYFTLTPATVNHINGSPWSTYDAAFGCDPWQIGTNYVYKAIWSSTNGWSEIDVLFSPADLGLSAGGDIDAIAYYKVSGHDEHIVFSVARDSAPGLEQILVGGPEIVTGGGNKPLRVTGGARINEKVGIANDTDIDSLCTYDPEHSSQAYGHWIAFPEPTTVPEGIGCSVARYRSVHGVTPAGQPSSDVLLLQATRLPNQSGLVGWFITIDGFPTMLVRQSMTSPREELHLYIPSGTEGISVKAACVAGNQVLRSAQVRLLRQ